MCPMWGWPLLLAHNSAKPMGSREAFQSEMQTTLNIRKWFKFPDFQEPPETKLFQSCRVSLCGSWALSRSGAGRLPWGMGWNLGYFLRPGLAGLFSLAKDTITFLCPFLSVRWFKTCLFQPEKLIYNWSKTSRAVTSSLHQALSGIGAPGRKFCLKALTSWS